MTRAHELGGWCDDAERDPIHLAAADWFTRLRDPNVSLEETLAWQDWVNADPRHSLAFARIEEVSNVLHRLPRPARPRRWGERSDRYDASVPLSEFSAPTRRPIVYAIAASLVIAATVIAGLWNANGLPFDFRSSDAQAFTTAIGENRAVKLADGSQVTLGGSTHLNVELAAKERILELTQGEAFFAVARDAARPFQVRAGNTAVLAVGTQFNVKRAADRVSVTVVEGRVRVEPVPGIVPIALLREFRPKLAPVSVDAGQQTTAGSAGIEAVSSIEDPAAATSWQSGRLTFRLQPLRYVLEDVNRYTAKRIELEDEALGSMSITGTVTGGNVKGWIGSLERAFGLEAVEEPERIVLRRR